MNKVFKLENNSSENLKGTLRVAAYCRVSTGSADQLESLSVQKEHYEKLIRANSKWTFAGLYYDEALSGTEMTRRDGLNALVQDCEKGLIDRILVKSLSRMARNTVDSLTVVRKLLKLNVSVFFEKENIDTGTMDSELILAIMSSLAEDESHSIAENCRWGARQRFLNGTYKLGCVPFGYSVSDGVLSIVPEEAETIRFIYDCAMNGMGCYQIVDILNSKGIKPRKSRVWNENSVMLLLTNEKYIGDCLFQKTYSDDHFVHRTNRGEREQYYMTDHHEPIIAKEVFETVQQLIANRRTGDSSKSLNRYSYSGKVICGQCGSRFKRRIVYNGSYSYPTLICCGHINKTVGCSVKAIRCDALEAAFTTMMNKLIFSAQIILKPYLQGRRSIVESDRSAELVRLKEQADENLRKRETLSSLVAQNFIEPSVYARENSELLLEASAITRRRQSLLQGMDGLSEQADSAADIYHFACSGNMLTDFDGELFDRFVDHVLVQSRSEVVFSLKCGLDLKEKI